MGPFREDEAEREENRQLKTRVAELEDRLTPKKKSGPTWLEYSITFVVLGLLISVAALAIAKYIHDSREWEQNHALPCYKAGHSDQHPDPWEPAYVFRCDTREQFENGCPAIVRTDGSVVKFDTVDQAMAFSKKWNLRMCK